jgi:ectoine hydroxylase-related dioxygenase (phytanoyl-CoA dioxygenase family)
MYFKTYNKNEELKKDGFTVLSDYNINEIVKDFSLDLEEVSKNSDNKDVFRTKLGYIKQIQNLDFKLLNKELARLINAKDYEVLNNQYFCKPPNYKMTSAHQDNAYFNTEEEVFTFWIPLQDVDLINSCMFYVPGSHLNGLVEHKPIGTNVRVRTGKKGLSLYSSFYENKEFVKVPLKKYEILIHDKNCMHFSSPNLSDDYRIAITCIMKIKEYYA